MFFARCDSNEKRMLAQVKELLEEKKKGAAILLVSADLEELMSLSDRMLILCGGKCSGEVTDVAAATEEEIGLLMGGITHSGEGGESA